MATYCNTTTDLKRAFFRVDEAGMKGHKTLKGYKSYSATLWKLTNVGYAEAMFEDGVKMTSVASLGACDAAQEYYYDSTNDVLYFYPTGSAPDNHTYTVGEDFDTVKSRMVAIASREAESMLDAKMPVPLPMSPDGTAAQPYDADFTHAVAKIACGYIVDRISPAVFDSQGAPAADSAAAQLLASGRAMIREYKEGVRRFSWEITEDEIGGANVRPGSTNTSAGIIQVRGKGVVETVETGTDVAGTTNTYLAQDQFWKVKLTLGGVLGTATWQVSYDDGTTYNGTDITTSRDWKLIKDNIWIRFLPRALGVTDFVINDTWQIELPSSERSVTNPRTRSISLRIA